MKLISKCNSCKKEMNIKVFMIENRIELAKKKGTEFTLRCENCGQTNSIHVDEVKAIEGLSVKLVGIISVVVAIALTAIFWNMGFIAYASFAIPILLISTVHKNQSSKIKQFNLLYYDSKRRETRRNKKPY